MQTLNKISQNIVDALGKPYDVLLRERVKYSVKYYRAEFIRQDVERNGMSSHFLQTFTAKLVKVDKADTCVISVGCTVLKTEKPIPSPVRVKGEVFKYVGGAGFGKAYSYRQIEELTYSEHNKYTGNSISYDYKNNHIYVFNTTKVKYVTIQAPFEFPEDVNSACSGAPCYTDDSAFPISADMLRGITVGLLGGELKMLNISDEEVNIENDGKQ